MANRDREQNDDWAQQVNWEHGQGPYRDYGWEKGQSALPEFRDPSVHVQPYERQRVSQWRKVNWDRDRDYGYSNEEGPYAGVGPQNYQRSDERIFEEVCERLTQHGMIDARNIQVDVKEGEVTLSGMVDSRQTKRRVENVADQVRGVKDIHNQLRIQEQRQGNMGDRGSRESQRDQSGIPGGGKGRVDEVGDTGVYPVSGPPPKQNAQVQGQASWGQGERGAAGYEDSGQSEITPPTENKEGRKQSGT